MEHCELGITLPKGFSKYDSGGTFDVAYTDGDLIVGMVRVSFSAGMNDGISATLTSHSFGEVYCLRAGLEDKTVFDYGDTSYVSYTNTVEGYKYRYTHTFYTTPYAYFIISFISHDGGIWGVEDALKLTGGVYLINI